MCTPCGGRRLGAASTSVTDPRPIGAGGRPGLPSGIDTTQPGRPDPPTGSYGVIPAAVQSLAYGPAHSCDAGTKLSLITVAFMLAVVTHLGIMSTEGTLTFAVVSLVVPLTSDDGGLAPARR